MLARDEPAPPPRRRRSFPLLPLAQRLLERPWFVRAIDPLFGRFNPFLPAYRVDPYPFYDRLRREAPVYFSPVLRGWVLSRHADIVAVLQDARFSVERGRSNLFQRLQPLRDLSPAFAEAITRNLLMLDPPDHTRLRRLVNKAFTPRMVDGLRPRIEALVDELLEPCAARGSIDLIRDFAYPLPVIVISEMLGLPVDDREQLKAWSDELAALLDPLQASGGMARLERTFMEVKTYFGRIFAERRRTPTDDLIGALVSVEDRGETLTEMELLSLVMLLLGAGHETTTNLIGNAVVALLRHPAERRRMQDDPALVERAVEEFLRWDSPVQLTDRVATVDCEVAGKRVRKGVIIALLLGAANRDPAAFVAPDRLDVGRSDNPHLSFSHGVHFCLGAALARVETRIALGALLRRFPDFGGDPQPRNYRRSMVLRGVTSLPLTLR